MRRRRTFRRVVAALVATGIAIVGPAVQGSSVAAAGSVPGTPSSGGQSVVDTDDPTVRPFGAVALVGDSLLVGSARHGSGWGPSLASRLAERGWGPIRVRAGVGFHVGRTLPPTAPGNIAAWLHRQHLSGFDPAVVVVNLGTNDIASCRGSAACAYANIRHLLDIIGPDRQVWWSLIDVSDTERERTWNDALRTVAMQRPNLVLWDWPAVQAAERVPMAADGIHLAGAGAYGRRSVLMADDITTRLGRQRVAVPAPAAPTAAAVTATTVPGATRPTTSLPTAPSASPPWTSPVSTADPPPAVISAAPPTHSPASTVPASPVPPSTVPPSTVPASTVPEPHLVALPEATSAPLGYLAIDPQRLVDTRRSGRRLAGGSTRVIEVAHAVGIDALDVRAVAVSIASVGAFGAGDLTVWPCGAGRPGTSAVRPERGVVRVAQVVSAVGDRAELCVWTSVSTNLVVDLRGVFVERGGDRFDPLLPTRLVEERATGRAQEMELAAPLGASALSLMVTVTGGSRRGALTAGACTGEARHWIAYWGPGETVTGSSFSAVGKDGRICLSADADADVAVDVIGVFRPDGRLRFQPVAPTRVVDSRTGAGGHAGPTVTGRPRRVVVGPVSAGAVSGSLAIIEPAGATAVAATLCGSPAAGVPRGGTRVSGVTAAVSPGGAICLYAGSPTDLTFDVTGWWVP